ERIWLDSTTVEALEMAPGGAQREDTNRALAVVATETQVTVKQVDHRVKKSTKPDLSRSDGDEIARS
ncbi:hypothetical protein LXA23_18210, partial [Erwinia amylovora]|nr:hypothetical protein [Erwinia amylovora]